MTFRTRLLAGALALALVPLVGFGVAARTAIEDRLTADYARETAAIARAMEQRIADQLDVVEQRLAGVRDWALGDNRLRAALMAGADRDYATDWAEGAATLAGLDALRLLDESGRIISSGHFRSEFGLSDAGLVPALERSGAGLPVLVDLATPDSSMRVLAAATTISLADRTFHLVGGTRLDPGSVPAGDISADLGGSIPAGAVGATFAIPVITGAPERRVETVTVAVWRSMGQLEELLSGLDRRLLTALAVSAVIASMLALLLAAMIARPITELAERTRGLDIDTLDLPFATDRSDELGELARLLSDLTHRLREGAERLREAERRAALGDLARQVNHDIKNGLIPIRNVLRHLNEVAEQDPDSLAGVLRERSGTLAASVTYLEGLAANYARLYPRLLKEPVDVSQLCDEIARVATRAAGPRVTRSGPAGLETLTDRLALRRVILNLVDNAVDSAGPSGTVELAAVADGSSGAVSITVSDTGPGMTREELNRAFTEFQTTKPGGTGLGLPVARRLTVDLGGTLRVETQPGTGTRVTIELSAGDA